jgi:bifunctional non-homologous end joining protein LigD
MLASRSKIPPEQLIDSLSAHSGWYWEIKFDGVRAVIDRDAKGAVTIYNRARTDITYRYPDVVATMGAVDFVGTVDGEIIVAGPDGSPDFALVHRRDAQSTLSTIRRMATLLPATFMPFDVLSTAGRDLRAFTYLWRREILTDLLPAAMVAMSSPEGGAMWAFVLERHLEGLIAKRDDSTYRPGRQKSWIKIVSTRRVTALVGGIIAGTGSRAVGALQLYLNNPVTGGLDYIGKVGSGMSDAEMGELVARLAQVPLLPVEIEYRNVSANGQLRMPVFKAIRTDVDVLDCTLNQLS